MSEMTIPAKREGYRLRAGDRIECGGVTIERQKDGSLVITAPLTMPLKCVRRESLTKSG